MAAAHTATMTMALQAAGHDVTISCAYGQQGSTDMWNDMLCLPHGVEGNKHGQDMVGLHYLEIKPDFVFSHHDSQVFHPAKWSKIPWAAWCMVDGEPLMQQKRLPLSECDWPLASSRWGQRVLAESGIDAHYSPYMFDDTVYKYRDKADARRQLGNNWGIDLADRYIVVVNSANVSIPGRKNLPAILQAWAVFHVEHPDSLLYMHTDPTGKLYGGWNLQCESELAGVNLDSVILPDVWQYACGLIPADFLATVYAASDLYLNPSKGEGFGMPTMEAQMCGCPAALTKFGPSEELIIDGYLISGQMIRDEPGCSHCHVPPDEIINALDWGFQNVNDSSSRKSRADKGARYGAGQVMADYILPFLDMIQTDLDAWGYEKYRKGDK